jgi:hypothetical protein
MKKISIGPSQTPVPFLTTAQYALLFPIEHSKLMFSLGQSNRLLLKSKYG